MIITASRWATTYYTSYSRALLSYANNGFFARDLDADDHAFIEGVRERGSIACGSLADPTPTQCTHSDDVIHRTSLLEEEEFWRLPYTVDTSIGRRFGPTRPPTARAPGTTPHAEQLRKNRELAAKALAEEHQRLVDRQIEQLRRDIEWERASAPFGRVVDRHFVPQWKLDDAKAEKVSRQKARAKQVKETRAEIAKERVALAESRKREREQELAGRQAVLNESRLWKTSDWLELQERRLAAEEEMRKQTEYEAQLLIRKEALRRELQARSLAAEEEMRKQTPEYESQLFLRKEALKRCIMATVRNNFPNPVTIDALLIATRCDDEYK
jgi:hypothetical protein